MRKIIFGNAVYNKKWNKILFTTVILAFITAAGLVFAADWKTFKGCWFEIKYPPDFSFIKTKCDELSSDKKNCDCATFISSDKLVEFYVFAPQWAGRPDVLKIDKSSEVLEAEKKSDIKPNSSPEVFTKWLTIKSKNGQYRRSYVITERKDGGVELVFGIKYGDKAAYEKYKESYQKFKSSLVRFAD